MSVWVNYEVERMNLDFNLDTMQLDEEGLWIDPGSAVGLNGLQAMFEGQCLDGEPEVLPWERAMHEGRERIEALQKAEDEQAAKEEGNNSGDKSEPNAKRKKFEFQPPRDPELLPPPRQTRRAMDEQVRPAVHAEGMPPKTGALEKTAPPPKTAPQRSTKPSNPATAAPRAGSVMR